MQLKVKVNLAGKKKYGEEKLPMYENGRFILKEGEFICLSLSQYVIVREIQRSIEVDNPTNTKCFYITEK